MASIVEKSVEVDAPVATVFAYVDDFSKTQEWMYGLTKLEPAGDQLRGVGATFDGTMRLGVALDSTIECVAHEENRLIEMTSIKGIKNTQRWTFTDLGDDRTRVDAWISYELPGGIAGAAIARAVKPMVGIAVKHTAETLVKKVEAL